MEAQRTWIRENPRGKPMLEGRALLGAPALAPEMVFGSVEPKHTKSHYLLVVTLLVLMVVAVGAICCCCYQWEGNMRIQARPRSPGHSEMTVGTPRSSANSRHSSGEFCNYDPGVSVSVIMPGDYVPRFVAWTAPQGAPAASAMPKTRQQTFVEPELNRGKLSGNSVISLNP